MKINKELVGRAVARLREMRGLTQSELNRKVGMSTIQHIEQGRNSVSLECLNKIATALDVPAACIVLLGSDIDPDDKLLASLRGLTEKTIRLQEEPKREKRTRVTGKSRRTAAGLSRSPKPNRNKATA